MISSTATLISVLSTFRIKLILPPTEKAPDGDSFQVIAEKALEACILALPGKSFFVLGRATPCMSLEPLFAFELFLKFFTRRSIVL